MSSDAPEVVVATVMRREGGSGVQTHVRTVVEHLEATGRPVRVVSPFDAASPLVRPVFAVRLALQPVSGAAGVWWYRHWHTAYLRAALGPALATARAGRRPPVVYAQCPGSALAALTVRERAGGAEPVVMAAHFNVSEADEWAGKGEIRRGGRVFRAVRELEARVLPRLDGLVFVSEAARRDCLARVPAAARVPSVVVPNAVPALPALPDPAGADPASPDPAGPLRDLVTVGSVEPRKNQGYLLEVLAEARRRGRPCTLTVVGDGPQRRGLERRARALGVERDVRLVGHRTDVPAWLAGHRVYCHAALTESFGIALAEAMRAGLPVVAGAVGGIPEVVRDGVEGRHWPLDDVAAATDLLLDLLDDHDTRRRMGRAGAARAADELGTQVVVPRLLDFLGSLSARPAPAPAGGAPR
ncbi:glycosyltransferase family 4 protein [Nocardioides sp. 31GB23]|uniref:Glycosyltransferase involved in cell wall biosynthesis n=1 Tax=Nocardioides salarius TaxID=374513 RepID=A0ABS2ME22_9ACTN|nr:glycosyltransferase family 4 protein [Nocardioides salarius]MBM7509438.1 glycosyltransferase involved in cell wall biosynthesis [Nocardioides salarius]